MRIYLAAPYSQGDIGYNISRAMDVANTLMMRGFYVFNPLLSHFQHISHPQPWPFWLDQDKEWLSICDAVLRLEGESKGADLEVKYAREHGIPVFNSVSELLSQTAYVLRYKPADDILEV